MRLGVQRLVSGFGVELRGAGFWVFWVSDLGFRVRQSSCGQVRLRAFL